MRQLSQRNCANCHNEIGSTATMKLGQLPQRKCVNCHNRIEKQTGSFTAGY
ncbi:cytochrome c3 family protein [Segatella copri]|uniref:cytochrome c3 family protein n=1 Tax=Segatella copri TaxID=165179 RepID=UPI003F59C8DC